MVFDSRTSEIRPSTSEFRISESGNKIKVKTFSEMRKMMRELAL